jgi:hypothetical protein
MDKKYLLVFMLVLLVCFIGFVMSAWQSTEEIPQRLDVTSSDLLHHKSKGDLLAEMTNDGLVIVTQNGRQWLLFNPRTNAHYLFEWRRAAGKFFLVEIIHTEDYWIKVEELIALFPSHKFPVQ